MVKNFKLTIEYDGGLFHGWQRQKDDRTVQGEIEKALFTMTRDKITLTGSGRTDAGVHAIDQVANFLCETNHSPEVFQKGLNSLVPEGVIIKECCQADNKFHARFDAKSKTYNYRILNRALPAVIGRQHLWYIRKNLDIDAMQVSIDHIRGLHDFKAFEGAGSPRSNTIRNVMKADLELKNNDSLVFEIKADGFLRFMVRNIVGTLVDVGLGKITPDEFKKILLSKDRANAGATAPPQGLFLIQVDY